MLWCRETDEEAFSSEYTQSKHFPAPKAAVPVASPCRTYMGRGGWSGTGPPRGSHWRVSTARQLVVLRTVICGEELMKPHPYLHRAHIWRSFYPCDLYLQCRVLKPHDDLSACTDDGDKVAFIPSLLFEHKWVFAVPNALCNRKT